ncbi:quaternary ammonium compound-resistance protein SugE [Streptosporangium becharense]|uniref:Quaternary ammonium compound-resistance protein SugE n=1 Tax=Streptosporangium becharense TaxID=1816182 RepID=A0A7W9IIL3_9ACTN|nr:multidrug efflux SMR transporter [Streptosporangium becharense]MBB2912363.1 quaternary ammonium compound-resistance protein SugE [Streptosporangium becharense]MBB5820808.1 quaternary ammonium compound-resistance protein SugE [Streptosporangium becharense]
MAWVLIVVAGLFEVAMAYSLKMSDGFSAPLPSVGFAVFAVLSFGLLALGLRSLEVGTAYAVWTGIGAVGTATLGILALGEDASFLKIASILLIVAGVVGLNLAGGQ